MTGLYIALFTAFFVSWAILRDNGPSDSRSNARGNPHMRNALHEYQFPQIVRDVFRKENPQLSTEQQELAFKGLKEYFMLMLLERQAGGRKSLGMPSVLVDEAWHAFVICTRHYEEFCLKFFGQMIHHAPDPAARPGALDGDSNFSADAINTWTVYRRGVRKFPAYFSAVGDMPLLFGLDAYVGLSTGWLWNPPALHALERQAVLAAGAGGAPDSEGSGASCTNFTAVNTWSDTSRDDSPAGIHHGASSSHSSHGGDGHGGSDSGGGHSCNGGGHGCSGSGCSGGH
jgi:hypothetical protein